MPPVYRRAKRGISVNDSDKYPPGEAEDTDVSAPSLGAVSAALVPQEIHVSILLEDATANEVDAFTLEASDHSLLKDESSDQDGCISVWLCDSWLMRLWDVMRCAMRNKRELNLSSATSASNQSLDGTERENHAVNAYYLPTQWLLHSTWRVILVYIFFVLPLAARLLNFYRSWGRNTIWITVEGVMIGFMQDAAIYLQAATLLACAVSIYSKAHCYAGFHNTQTSTIGSASLRQDVSLKKQSNFSELEQITGTVSFTRKCLGWCAGWLLQVIIYLTIEVILVLSTLANLIDLSLQMTMHPRLNRAFVEIFANYASQFYGTITDGEVLTPAIVSILATYAAMTMVLSFAYFSKQLPTIFESSNWEGSSKVLWREAYVMEQMWLAERINTLTCLAAIHRIDEFDGNASFRRKRRTSSISTNNAVLISASNKNTGQSFASKNSSHQSSDHDRPQSNSTKSVCEVVKYIWPRFMANAFVSVGALLLSIHFHTNGKNGGLDVKWIANPMFALQTEQFFQSQVVTKHVKLNCSQASQQIRMALSPNEKYTMMSETVHDCALLWRKTNGFTGPKHFDLDWTSEPVTENLVEAEKSREKVKKQPNIIMINLESWRALDVGVLGAMEKAALLNKSVTPYFDALCKDGILFRNHYTQAVQTSRTLLTTLFGVLPSATETTALKQYGTSLNLRGLPQFLKSRGYHNMFWSAVDLTWESWDDVLRQNGFDKLVDESKVREIVHSIHDYVVASDDYFSWGTHDHLSFEALLHVLENAQAAESVVTESSDGTAPATHAKLINHANPGSASPRMFANWSLPFMKKVLMEHKSQTVRNTNGHKEVTKKNNSSSSRKIKDLVDDARKLLKISKTASNKSEKSSKTSAKSKQKRVIDGVLKDLKSPYFIDMYTISSHNPWNIPAAYDLPDLEGLNTRFNTKYLQAMAFSDQMLGEFMSGLRKKGLMKDTVILIQGDHGYGRLEHGNNPSLADSGVYDEASHIPFLILADDYLSQDQKGMQIEDVSMQSDIMATIADILGVSETSPLYQHGVGHSMMRKQLPINKSRKRPDIASVSAAEAPTSNTVSKVLDERRIILCNPFDGMTLGVRVGDLKYIFFPDGAYKVFDLSKDPLEQNAVKAGFDVTGMDADTIEMYKYASQQNFLGQFLYQNNRFVPTESTQPIK